MFTDISKAISLFKKSGKIAVFCQNINTLDKAMSIVALSRLCKSEKKELEVICPGKIKGNIKDIFDDEGLYVIQEPKSKNYVVSIDYSNTNIDKVICKRDEETNKLNFVITPGDELFSFDNVDLIAGGGDYDVIFSFGVHSLEQLDDSLKDIYEGTKIISITKKESSIGDYKFLINGTRSYSEVIYEFYKAFSSNLTQDVLNILLKGVIGRYKILVSEKSEGWELVSNLIKYGADPNKALQDIYYSKDKKNLNLQQKVVENMLTDDDNRVIWSKISLDEVSGCGIDKSNLDVRGRIIFNISKDFDIALVVYHLETDLVKVVLESNNPQKYSAIKLAKAFNGSGSKTRAVFTNTGLPSKSFEKRLLESLENTFNIKLENYNSTVV